MRFKSLDTFPPGGWQFRQPELRWSAPGGLTVKEVTHAVIKVRRDNPHVRGLSTDLDTVFNEVVQFNLLRVASMKHADSWLVYDDPAKKAVRPPPSRTQGGQVVDVGLVAGVIKKVTVGAKTIIDWFGHGGKPVPQQLAENRAAICASCPQNDRAKTWTDYIKDAAAATVHRLLEAKAQMEIRTSKDDELGTCRACWCKLDLKVHAPLDVIRKEMPESVKKDLDPRCWVLRE